MKAILATSIGVLLGIVINLVSGYLSPHAANRKRLYLSLLVGLTITAAVVNSLPDSVTLPSAVSEPPLPTVQTEWTIEIPAFPKSGTQHSQPLRPGQLLFVSAGQIELGGRYCGGDKDRLCVFIYQASTTETVPIRSLIPSQGYLAVSDTLGVDDALAFKRSEFWRPPNCITGCKYATIHIYSNGQWRPPIRIEP